MKGFSIPSISIPNLSLPSISFNGSNINAESIRSSIEARLPNFGSLVDGINLEETASDLLSENLSNGIDLPSELSKIMVK